MKVGGWIELTWLTVSGHFHGVLTEAIYSRPVLINQMTQRGIDHRGLARTCGAIQENQPICLSKFLVDVQRFFIDTQLIDIKLDAGSRSETIFHH